MNLVNAIQPHLPARIAIVGGGGKTTALFQLGRQLDGLTWVTTTTHLGTDQLDIADRHFLISTVSEIDLHLLKTQKLSLLTGPFTPDDRVRGLSPEVLEQIVQLANDERISLVVEADGARSHPVKAPAEHEPVIPEWVEMVIVVVGCAALGKPLNSEWVHRPDQFSLLTGLKKGQIITPESLARMFIHPLGGLKGIPKNARKVALFNQIDTVLDLAPIKNHIPEMIEGGYDKVILSSLKDLPEDVTCFDKNGLIRF